MAKIGFIGLGNVGGKLAGSLLRNGFDLMVRDLDKAVAEPFWQVVRHGQTARKRWPKRATSRLPVCRHLWRVPRFWRLKTAFWPGCPLEKYGQR